MENGFVFELYEQIYTNCFIHISKYSNGNLQLSLFGVDPELNQTSHFADITLNQNIKKLKSNEIIVNNRFKPTLIPQLENLGILKEKKGMCIINNTFYPIYTVDFSKIMEKSYYLPELAVA